MEISKQLTWLFTKRDITIYKLHYYIYITEGHDPIIKVDSSSGEFEWAFVLQTCQLSFVVLFKPLRT
jgi:hypothetical protein